MKISELPDYTIVEQKRFKRIVRFTNPYSNVIIHQIDTRKWWSRKWRTKCWFVVPEIAFEYFNSL